MARFLEVSTCALGVVLAWAPPASAYRVDRAQQKVVIGSLRDFDKCEEDRDKLGAEACLDALKVHVGKHPKDAFEAGKRARLHYMHWLALDFFVQALGDGRSDKQCADEDVRAAVVSGLALPPHYPAVGLAAQLLREACPKQLEASVIAQLRGASGYFRSNTCALIGHKLKPAQCAPPAEERSSEAPPAPPPEPTKAEQLAKARALRETPPVREEPPSLVRASPLADVFPPLGAARGSATASAGAFPPESPPLDIAALDRDGARELRGTHGEQLLIARTKLGADEYVLLKFKGVRSPWNERVLLATERNGNAGREYVVLLEDGETVVMVERQHQYQAFPKGVRGGVWLNAVSPGEPALELPARPRQGKLVAAGKPAK